MERGKLVPARQGELKAVGRLCEGKQAVDFAGVAKCIKTHLLSDKFSSPILGAVIDMQDFDGFTFHALA
jgi:hypothetical protein